MVETEEEEEEEEEEDDGGGGGGGGGGYRDGWPFSPLRIVLFHHLGRSTIDDFIIEVV